MMLNHKETKQNQSRKQTNKQTKTNRNKTKTNNKQETTNSHTHTPPHTHTHTHTHKTKTPSAGSILDVVEKIQISWIRTQTSLHVTNTRKAPPWRARNKLTKI